MHRAAVLLAILVAAVVAAIAQPRQPDVEMATAAKALLAALDAEQLAKIRWPFDSEERLNWHFVPRERQGLSLKNMRDTQRDAAMKLLRAGLSEKGYGKAEAIRELENVLHAMTGSAIRDPHLYYFTIFGDPGEGTWAWRYEGHHLSQNWTVIKGKPIATTPAFFGANPAEVPDGPLKGRRALAAEEDLAFALLASFTPEQLKQVVTDPKAPPDIVTGNTRKAAILENVGLQAQAMTPKQQALLTNLIEEHAASQPPALAAERMKRVRADGIGNVRFAWMGATTKGPGNAHYYRIQGAAFLIEYDNTQNRANHQHVVWRDFTGDFGADVLAAHYAASPHDRR